MIDSHCHFDFDSFDADRLEVAKRCIERGISGLIIPGVDERQWQAAAELCENWLRHETADFRLWHMAGLHPLAVTHHHANQTALEHLLGTLKSHCEKHQPLALGETGLDRRLDTELPLESVFLGQIELAAELKLPLCLHSVGRHNDVLRILKQNRFSYGGIIHAFAGSPEEAFAYRDLGFAPGFGGLISYPRAAKTRRALQALNEGDFVLETDAPDMPLAGAQGQRNTPDQLAEVASIAANLRGEDFEQVITSSQACLERVLPRLAASLAS